MIILSTRSIMVSLNIHFKNQANFFFEGEEINAKLEVNVEEPVDINWLTVTFNGVTKCIRVNHKEATEQTIWHVVLPTKNEIKKHHFNHSVLLYKINYEKTDRLLVGPHEFKFAYQLPTNLPSSLECNEAYVRYFILVTADVNGEIMKKTEFFTVVSNVDLNNFQITDKREVLWLNQNVRPVFSALMFGDLFSCGCCRCGDIRACLLLDKTGYVPGETIKVYAQINNLSGRTVEWVKASLVQTIKFNCSKTIKRKRVINEVLRGAVMPYESQLWKTEEIPIPPIPPTTVDNAGTLVYVVYKLYFQIKPSRQDKAIVIKKKLVIGSIPSRQITKKSEEQGQGDLNAVPEIDANFEFCVFGPHNVEEEGIFSSYSPMYPVYDESY